MYQELLTLTFPDPHEPPPSFLVGLLVAQSLVFYIVLCGHLLFFCAWNISTSLTYGLGMSLLL
jgi:hypothetical protein